MTNLVWVGGLRVSRLTLCLGLAWGGAVSWAQTETVLKEVVVTATRSSSELDSIPATVTSVTRAQLDRSVPTNESDLFKGERDIAFARDLRRHGATRINIRGIEDNRVVSMVDAPSGAPPPALDGRIWDVAARQFISAQAAYQRAASSRYVLLGEKHDSEVHHARQLDVLQALAARGVQPVLTLEQFDAQHQVALSAAQKAGTTDAQALADAGQLNRTGWRWPMYQALIAYAAQQQWPLVAANLSRTQARDIALGKLQP